MRDQKPYILTGAPGAGKTTVLQRLGPGIRTVDEPAREIIAEQRSIGGSGTSDRDPSLFVELLLRRSIDKYEAAQRWEDLTIFDRGVPDCVAYADRLGVDQGPSILASEWYRYHPDVLILEPWEEIYEDDDERTMSFGDTVAFHEAIVTAYVRAGYALVPVPRDSIENRTTFIRAFIAASLPPPGTGTTRPPGTHGS